MKKWVIKNDAHGIPCYAYIGTHPSFPGVTGITWDTDVAKAKRFDDEGAANDWRSVNIETPGMDGAVAVEHEFG